MKSTIIVDLLFLLIVSLTTIVGVCRSFAFSPPVVINKALSSTTSSTTTTSRRLIHFVVQQERQQQQILFAVPPRYGPPSASQLRSDPLLVNVTRELKQQAQQGTTTTTKAEQVVIDAEQAEWERQDALRVKRQRLEYRSLIEQILELEQTEHLPGLMSKHMDLLLTMRGYEVVEVMEELLKEAKERDDDGDDDEQQQQQVKMVAAAMEFVTQFVEEFVQQTQEMDGSYKNLLGKIIRVVTDNRDHLLKQEQEDLLDALIERERSNFTPGFLRHVEGECKRIRGAPQMTPDSTRLLETLCVIQTRVLEELGKDMSEGAQFLGQLMGYESNEELLGVLDAGLTVRGGGLDFAMEIQALVEEALRGFVGVADVEPGLVRRVELISNHLNEYIAKQRNGLRP